MFHKKLVNEYRATGFFIPSEILTIFFLNLCMVKIIAIRIDKDLLKQKEEENILLNTKLNRINKIIESN